MSYDFDDIDELRNTVDSFMISLRIRVEAGAGPPSESDITLVIRALDKLRKLGQPHKSDFIVRSACYMDNRSMSLMSELDAKYIVQTFVELCVAIDKGTQPPVNRKNIAVMEMVAHAITNFPVSANDDAKARFNEAAMAMFDDYIHATTAWVHEGRPNVDLNSDVGKAIPRFVKFLDTIEKIPLVNTTEVGLVRSTFLTMIGARDSYLENHLSSARTMCLDDGHPPVISEGHKNYVYDPKEALADLFNQAKDFAGKIVSREEEVLPFAVMRVTVNPETGKEVDAPGINIFISAEGGGFTSSEHQDEFMNQLRTIADKTRALAYVFCAESWGSFLKKSEMTENFQPSKDPNRKTVVVVCGQHIGGELQGEVAEIKKGEPLEFMKNAVIKSKYENILKPLH